MYAIKVLHSIAVGRLGGKKKRNFTLTAKIGFLHKHENFKAPVLDSLEKEKGPVILCVTENLTRALQSCKLQVQNIAFVQK